MADLFDTQRPPKPERIARSLELALGDSVRQIERREPLTMATLSPDMRSRLIDRRKALHDQMRTGSHAEIIAALETLVDMRGGYKPADREDALKVMKRRIADLGDVPIWAIWEAVDAFRLGKIGAGVLKPTTGQLRLKAKEAAESFFAELARIERVLKEPLVAEPTRADLARKKEMAERMRAMVGQAAQAPRQGDRAARR